MASATSLRANIPGSMGCRLMPKGGETTEAREEQQMALTTFLNSVVGSMGAGGPEGQVGTPAEVAPQSSLSGQPEWVENVKGVLLLVVPHPW